MEKIIFINMIYKLVRKAHYIFLPLLFFSNPLLSQNDHYKDTKVTTISNTPLKDCYVTAKNIWMLRDDGVIILANKENYTKIDSLKFPHKIVAIGKSPADTIYAATEKGDIFCIFDNRHTRLVWSTKQKVKNFIFTSYNKCFLITDKGIYDPQETKRLYYENAFSRSTVAYYNRYSWNPSSVFIDKDNYIWLGFSAGEWGGDIIIFSTADLNFIRLKDRLQKTCNTRPVRSFFQIDSTVYAVSSLQHMRSIRSAIFKITDSCRYYFESPRYTNGNTPDSAENIYKKQEIYMGPAAYNSDDSCIYFYCQFGVFKGNINNNLDKLENWNNVLETKFMWLYGMPDAAGYDMNVAKLFFEDNKMIIVAPTNGILIWDGKQKTLLKTTYKPVD